MPEAGQVAIGDRVRHPDWGWGSVQALVRGGRILRIEFEEMKGTLWDVPRMEVEVLKEAPPTVKKAASGGPPVPPSRRTSVPKPRTEREGQNQPAPPTPATPRAALASRGDPVTAAQAIEALRLGVVPRDHLDVYTVGRDRELRVVQEDLTAASRHGGLRVILGDYGTGKTHVLEMVERLALNQGFLTSRATLDTQENLPNRPRRIFHQLARGIRYPDDPAAEPQGLRPLLEKAAGDRDRIRRWALMRSQDYHPYLGPALFYWALLSRLGDMDALQERLLDWIEGSEVASNEDLEVDLRRVTAARTRLFALKDFRTVTHLYTLILGGLSILAREVGYTGLAVMVDEAEFCSVLRGEDRTFADILFRTFCAACVPPSGLRFDPEKTPRGGHPIHRSFSYRYKEGQPLYSIFALTHDPEGKALLERALHPDRFTDLTPFTPADYEALVGRVLSLYGISEGGFKPGEGLIPLMGSLIHASHSKGLIENPRQALKFITELVDITRHSPNRLQRVLRDLAARFETSRG